jgi:hypothetical protein
MRVETVLFRDFAAIDARRCEIHSGQESVPGVLEVLSMTDKLEKSYRFTNLGSTRYISNKIDELEGARSQREVGMMVGWPQPAMISMIKRGEVKPPLEKVPALARALNVDEMHLVRLVMRDHHPTLYATLEPFMGGYTSKNERDILNFMRELTGTTDPELDEDLKNKLRIAFS